MSDALKNFFDTLAKNPNFDLSLDEIRAKYGDSALKSQNEINRITDQFYKTFKYRPRVPCLHPFTTKCSGKPVGSHSLQRAILSRLADETNHVLMFSAPFTHSHKPVASIARMGIKRASRFSGLCAKHDSELFAPIENNDIDIDNMEHHFLFAYRALLREYSAKTDSYERIKKLVDWYCNERSLDQFVMAVLMVIAYSQYLGKFFIHAVKRYLDIAFASKKFDSFLDYGVREIDASLPVFASSVFTPIYDRDFRPIQDFGDYKKPPKYVFLTLVPMNSRSYLFYATIKEQSEDLTGFVRGFKDLEVKELLDYLGEVLLKHIENFIVAPSHWNAFSPNKQESIVRFFNDTVFNKRIAYASSVHNIFVKG